MKNLPSIEELKIGGVLLIDKPLTWTSFNAISKVRKMIHAKIGHAGTLDPLATGLLICCTGKFTKKITEFQQQEKNIPALLLWVLQRQPTTSKVSLAMTCLLNI